VLVTKSDTKYFVPRGLETPNQHMPYLLSFVDMAYVSLHIYFLFARYYIHIKKKQYKLQRCREKHICSTKSYQNFKLMEYLIII